MADQDVQVVDDPEFQELGQLKGHSDWITSMQMGVPALDDQESTFLISGSRDKTMIIWKLNPNVEEGICGQAVKQLTGHNHFVTDLCMSSDNSFLISSSWDKTLRLWDLNKHKTTRNFVGHSKEVYTCAFSPDNRQIISAGADRGIKLWNTLAQCKFTSEANNHTDWVSTIRYSPLTKSNNKIPVSPYFVSVGWDGRMKIWNTNFQIKYALKPHVGAINTVAVSPNGRYLASGGKDQTLNIWDVTDFNDQLKIFKADATINQVSFNPKFQWVACGTDQGIKIWNLMQHTELPTINHQVEMLHKNQPKKDTKKPKYYECTSLCWNSTGRKLFAGFTDGIIRVYSVQTERA